MRNARFPQTLLACGVAALAACGSGAVDIGVPAQCNPLGGQSCLAPWPPSAYLAADASSPTGVRLAFPAGAVPANSSGVAFDVAHVNGRTGFSPATQIVANFGVALDGSNLVNPGDLARSLTADSPTVLIDTDTDQLVAHFAELDANVPAEQSADQALYVRPAARLAGGHHYLVAIKKTLHAAGGGALAVPPGFAALVSGDDTTHDLLEAMRPRYAQIFDRLAAHGIAKQDLLVAWEFVTADDDSLRADLLATRDAALAAAGADGANLQIHDIQIEANPRPGLAKKVTFTFDSPTVRGDGGLLRDGNGRPIASGTSPARGVALIPDCATAAAPTGVTVYGHGFLGGIEETGGAYVQNFAIRTCRIVIGTDWRGMAQPDATDVILAMGDLNRAFPFGERIAQGIVDMVVLTQLARGKLRTQVLTDAQGATVAAAGDVTFYGISQGAILGGTFFTVDPVLRRGTLMVTGANWSVLFERSNEWAVMSVPLKGSYDNPLKVCLMEQVMQMALDVIDPVHWAPTVAGPGTTGKQYLLYASLGDALVTNLSAWLEARTMDIPVVSPSVEVPYGLSMSTGTPASAIVIVDEHPTPLPPASNLVNDQPNVAHEYPRRRTRIIDQIDQFFDTGTITNTCDGACDCAAGACGDLVPD